MKQLCLHPLKKLRVEQVAGSRGSASLTESVASIAHSPVRDEWKLLDNDSVMLLPLRDRELLEGGSSDVKGRRNASGAKKSAANFLSTFCEWMIKSDEQKKTKGDSTIPSSTIRVRLAAFDMDDTLIMPKKGSVFAKKGDPNDWKWVTPNVPTTLSALSNAGYILVVFTNQAGIGQGSAKGWDSVDATSIQRKLVSLRDALGSETPFMAVVSTGKNRWRKPSTSMWELAEQIIRREVLTAIHHVYGSNAEAGYTEERGLRIPIEVDCRRSSFYCGDAAGRIECVTLAGRKKDFSCADRKFAHNVGVSFYLPEQIFTPSEHHTETEMSIRKRLFRDGRGGPLNMEALQCLPAASVPFTWDGVDPAVLRQWPTTYAGVMLKMHLFPYGNAREVEMKPAPATQTLPLPLPSQSLCRSDGRQEMVILVGFPGCGKTTFYHRFFAPLGYVHVNRDTLKSKVKCLAVTREAWASGKSVVVDNTNPSSAARMEYIRIVAGEKGKGTSPLPIRVFIFQHSLQEAMHWNEVRYQSGVLDSRIPAVAFFSFRKQFTPYSEDVMRAERVEAVYEVPPVVCFDGLPREVATHFYQLF